MAKPETMDLDDWMDVFDQYRTTIELLHEEIKELTAKYQRLVTEDSTGDEELNGHHELVKPLNEAIKNLNKQISDMAGLVYETENGGYELNRSHALLVKWQREYDLRIQEIQSQHIEIKKLRSQLESPVTSSDANGAVPSTGGDAHHTDEIDAVINEWNRQNESMRIDYTAGNCATLLRHCLTTMSTLDQRLKDNDEAWKKKSTDAVRGLKYHNEHLRQTLVKQRDDVKKSLDVARSENTSLSALVKVNVDLNKSITIRLEELKAENQRVSGEYDQKIRECKTLEEERDQKIRECKTLEEERDQKFREFETLEGELQLSKQKFDNINRVHIELEYERTRCLEDFKGANTENATLEKENRSISDKLKTLNEKHKKVRTELDRREQEWKRQKQVLEDRRVEAEGRHGNELQRLKHELNGVNQRNTDLRLKYDRDKEGFDDAQQKLKDCEQALEDAIRKHDALAAAYDELQTKRPDETKHDQELQTLQTFIDNQVRELDESKRKVIAHETTIRMHEEAHSEAQAKLDEKQAEVKRLENELDGKKTVERELRKRNRNLSEALDAETANCTNVVQALKAAHSVALDVNSGDIRANCDREKKVLVLQLTESDERYTLLSESFLSDRPDVIRSIQDSIETAKHITTLGAIKSMLDQKGLEQQYTQNLDAKAREYETNRKENEGIIESLRTRIQALEASPPPEPDGGRAKRMRTAESTIPVGRFVVSAPAVRFGSMAH